MTPEKRGPAWPRCCRRHLLEINALHEAGHVFAAALYGWQPPRVALNWPLSVAGRTWLGTPPPQLQVAILRQDMTIHLAGAVAAERLGGDPTAWWPDSAGEDFATARERATRLRADDPFLVLAEARTTAEEIVVRYELVVREIAAELLERHVLEGAALASVYERARARWIAAQAAQAALRRRVSAARGTPVAARLVAGVLGRSRRATRATCATNGTLTPAGARSYIGRARYGTS